MLEIYLLDYCVSSINRNEIMDDYMSKDFYDIYYYYFVYFSWVLNS